MAPIVDKSQSLPHDTLADWERLVRRAHEQQFDHVGTQEKVQAGQEATNDVFTRGISSAIEKALASRWIDPLGQRPLGYVLRLEEMRKMEAQSTGPWAEDASKTAFEQTGGPTSSK